MSSLPEWAASRAKWSGGTLEGSPVLNPAFAPLTATERGWIEKRTAEVADALNPRDGVVVIQHKGEDVALSQEEAKLVLVTKLMMSKPSAAMSEDGAAARGEAYLFAIEDVPVWAVELAIRRWHAGKTEGVEKRDDFKWTPDSSVLERAARAEMAPLQRLHDRLVAVRDAKPLAEIAVR